MAKKNKKKYDIEPDSQQVQVQRVTQAAEDGMAAKATLDAGGNPAVSNEDSERALKEAVEAARESAAVLREAANALSQSAAQSVAVSRWGQFPGQNMGMPNTGAMPMLPPQLPPQYADNMRAPMMDMSGSYPSGYYNDAAVRRNYDLRESVGYSPKEPGVAKVVDEDRGGKRWSSPIKSLKSRVASVAGGSAVAASGVGQQPVVDASVLSGLPKFGEAPDPLPTPQEILASLPSFEAVDQSASTPTSVSAPAPAPTSAVAPSAAVSVEPVYQQPQQSVQVPVADQSEAMASAAYADSTAFSTDVSTSATQVIPSPEHVIEVPAQEVVYSDMQPADPYTQTYNNVPEFDPATMYDPTQVFEPVQQPYEPMQPMYDQTQQLYDSMQQPYDPTQQLYDPLAYSNGAGAYNSYPDAVMYTEPVKGGKATMSLILGILSILLAFIPPLGLVLAIIAVLLAKSYTKKGGTAPRASTGRVCGIVGIVLSLLLAVAIGVFVAYFIGGLYGESNAGAIMGYLQTTPLAQFL
ncbi:hypothetical protein [Adlercreutzia sp. ZJ304]|uniref:hypothetical protein n=1 Tax=Adlercreutzia sp. ZJ304 TaxID=2709791 RepID=UPI0013E9A190|nr:hypothetical protein [Adlercreutzia sp. ZJ304]